ncbi:hypothetical protein NUW54_g11048 [Trametes sanguinea]|uniref:Uncharacterized protein n=1 Tax=Trametes sanguinea TaxID=158606 RepID=A0ACC1NMH2_9APHY|nr:hypothetical protein NUW54_g11048 [Trametes sanguinea]
MSSRTFLHQVVQGALELKVGAFQLQGPERADSKYVPARLSKLTLSHRALSHVSYRPPTATNQFLSFALASLSLVHARVARSSQCRQVASIVLAVELLVVPEDPHAELLPLPARDILSDAFLALHPLMELEDVLVLLALLELRHALRELERHPVNHVEEDQVRRRRPRTDEVRLGVRVLGGDSSRLQGSR